MSAFSFSDDDRDSKTQSTATEALLSKYSSCFLGYFEDRFLRLLMEPTAASKPLRHKAPVTLQTRKPPIINRGYYTRVSCIQSIINSFLSASDSLEGPRQIVSIGCGFDTQSLLLCEKNLPRLRLIEVDFPKIVQRKADLLVTFPDICQVLATDPSVAVSKVDIANGITIGKLTLLAVDIREPGLLVNALLEAGVDPSTPTLFISECVLVYIDQHSIQSVCTEVASSFTNAAWVSYDMVQPNDAFGRVMLQNLCAARHYVPGFTDYPDLCSQCRRFTDNTWTTARSCTMLEAYNHTPFVSAAEKHRIARLEIFDEVEEWQLIMSHYCLTLAVNGSALAAVLNDMPAASRSTSRSADVLDSSVAAGADAGAGAGASSGGDTGLVQCTSPHVTLGITQSSSIHHLEAVLEVEGEGEGEGEEDGPEKSTVESTVEGTGN